MNRVQKLRNRHEVINVKVGEGEESFMISIPLPTPYETQMILFDSLDKNSKEDEYKTGANILIKALNWIDENMPVVDGEKMSLNDLTQEEIEPVKEVLKDIFFRTNKKQVRSPSKRASKK